MIPARGPQTKLKLAAGLRYPGLGTLTTSKILIYRLLAARLRYPGLGTLTTSKILIYRLLAAGLRYPGLGTLTPEQNPEIQAIGSWA